MVGNFRLRQTARCGCLSITFAVCISSRRLVALVEQNLLERVEGPEGVACGRDDGHGIAAALAVVVDVNAREKFGQCC
jgi:hypothetical protein